MSNSRSKLRNIIRKGKRTLQEAQQRNHAAPTGKPESVPSDPVEFAKEWLGFQPTPYQGKLLRDAGKRIVVVYPRRSGKRTTLAIRMIHQALTHPATTSLVVSPGLRQSKTYSATSHPNDAAKTSGRKRYSEPPSHSETDRRS